MYQEILSTKWIKWIQEDRGKTMKQDTYVLYKIMSPSVVVIADIKRTIQNLTYCTFTYILGIYKIPGVTLKSLEHPFHMHSMYKLAKIKDSTE